MTMEHWEIAVFARLHAFSTKHDAARPKEWRVVALSRASCDLCCAVQM